MLSRDRSTWLTSGLLIAIAVIAWAGVILQAAPRSAQGAPAAKAAGGMAMTVTDVSPSFADAAAYLSAWLVMMTAMMLPSAAPMIAWHGAVRRRLSQTGQNGTPSATVLFSLVYLAVWLAFGIPVYAASVAVEMAASASPVIEGYLPYALAMLLFGAGAYQLSALKRGCLRACRNPVGFLIGRWRRGLVGTLKMAMEHATYCVGCCWGLMVVLVAAGAMALHWVLLVAALVLVEKLFPRGERAARVIGVALCVMGLLVAAQPGLATVLRGQFH